MLNKQPLVTCAAAALMLGAGSIASADVPYLQGFESDTGDWTGAGSITRVASGDGTVGVLSSSGSYHAEVVNGGANDGGYTRFGGSTGIFPGTFTQSLDIYIDTTWTAPASGAGFKLNMYPAYTDGSSNAAAGMQFLIFVDDATDKVRIEANGRTGNGEDITTLENSGWYTFEATFRKGATGDDPVQVDLSVYDHAGLFLGMQTRPAIGPAPHDPRSSALGGNGYAWISNWQSGFAGNVLAIDNARTVPEPASLALLGLGGGMMLLRRRG